MKKYNKNIFVMTAFDGSQISTVSIETKDTYSTCSINFSLKDLYDDEYSFCIRDREGNDIFLRQLGKKGQICGKFSVDNIVANKSELHCILYSGFTPFMYGTNSDKKFSNKELLHTSKKKVYNFDDSTFSCVIAKKDYCDLCKNEFLENVASEIENSVELYKRDVNKNNTYIQDRIINNSDKIINFEDYDFENNDEGHDSSAEVFDILEQNEISFNKYNDDAIATVNYYQNANSQTIAKEPFDPDIFLSNEVISEESTNNDMECFNENKYDNFDIENNFDKENIKKNVKFISPSVGLWLNSIKDKYQNTNNVLKNFDDVEHNIKSKNISVEKSYYSDNKNIGDDIIKESQEKLDLLTKQYNTEFDYKMDKKQLKGFSEIKNKWQQDVVNNEEHFEFIKNNNDNNYSFYNKYSKERSGVGLSNQSYKLFMQNNGDIKDIPMVKNNPSSVMLSADEIKPLSFFDGIKEQVYKLFAKYQKEELLSSIMPDTKWVKVDYDNSGKSYVIGLIGQKPDYICYGVPVNQYTNEPPKELDGYCQWVPIDNTKPQDKGYWLMFQDAKTGDSVASI